MEGIQIVTIEKLNPLYKKNEEANKVELVSFEENGFHVISQKGLFSIGDRAVYIIPDFCVNDKEIFKEFIAPDGDESKSYLGKIEGKPRRIRAKKFSLSTVPNGEPTYSNGILLPLTEVAEFLKVKPTDIVEMNEIKPEWLNSKLEITKYEEPEVIKNSNNGYFSKGLKEFPSGVYKTDETNINMLWNHIEKELTYPITLIGTEKIDGSSISIGVIPEYPEGFIASRNIIKPLKLKKIIGRRKKTFLETLMFWRHSDLNIYDEIDNPDDFVRIGKYYLDLLLILKMENVILRGELNGKGLRGSGNPNNPSVKNEPNIMFFNVDDYVNGVAIKKTYDEFIHFADVWGLPRVPVLFEQSFSSRKHIENVCKKVFENIKKNEGRIIEGIVLNTTDKKFSVKFMNDEYDSKK